MDIFANSTGGGPTGNTIGGTSAGYANTIASNGGYGVYISGSGATLNLVEGNFIGTNPGDDTGLGNTYSGVMIDDGPSDNRISGNVIGSNGYDGVTIEGSGTSGNLVEDNFIGTDSRETSGWATATPAWRFTTVPHRTRSVAIRSPTTARNGYGGVNIAGADDNVVESNTIVGNDNDGVDIFGGATDNTIGGTIAGQGNTIAENNAGGVNISGADGNGNPTSGNVVVGNFIGTDAEDDPGMGNGLVGVTIFAGARTTRSAQYPSSPTTPAR